MAQKPPTDINLDSILVEIGQFGPYQIYTVFLLLIPVIFSALAGQEYIFTAGDLNYRCHVPECELNPADANINASWIAEAIPANERCLRFTTSGNQTTPLPGTCPAIFSSQTEGCDEYVYEKTNTIVYDFNMNCEDWKRTLVGTLRSVGTLIILPFTGYVSDRFGRRTALIINALNGAIVGLIRSFSNSYEMYLVLSLIEPSIGAGVYSSCFILATEMLGPKWRSMGGILMSSGFATGQVLLGLLAWAIPEWRTLTRVLYVPQFTVIVYFWILSESVRWLLIKGKFDLAEKTLRRAAKFNGRELSTKSIDNLTASIQSMSNIPDTVDQEPQPSLLRQVLKSKVILKRICVAPVWWITSTLVYYGLAINSVGLSGNMYINFILVSVIEIPGYITAYFALNFIGRKPTLCVSFIMCGIANFVFPFIPEDLEWLSLIFYLLGKYFISMTLTSIYIYTSELFPTNSRHSLLAFSSMVGRLGSIAAPQTPLLAQIWAPFPTTVFGSMAVLSGLLVLLTPETKGTKLPDTIEEAENIDGLKIYT